MDEAERDIEKVVQLAHLYMSQRNPTRTLEVLDKATGAIHHSWEYWYYRAWALAQLRRFAEGMAAAKRGLEIFPEHSILLWVYALNQDGAGQIEDARSTLLQGLQNYPDALFLLTESAWLAARLWKWEEANRYQKRAEQIAPTERMVKRNQLRLAALKGDTKAVRRIGKAILAEEPEEPVALYLLGLVAKNRGSLGEAEKQLRRAVVSDPSQIEVAEEARTVRLLRHPLLYPVMLMRRVRPIPMILIFVIVEEIFRQSGRTDMAVAVIFGFACFWQYTIIASFLMNLILKQKGV
jgi:tetratricopeptide (TPR) repeat protein